MTEKKGFISRFLGKKAQPAEVPAQSTAEISAVEDGGERIASPLAGKVLAIESVPDKVFADKILGDGLAIQPDDGKVYAPADGTVESLLDSHHAIGILTNGGAELLIHVGKDTVALNGRCFTAYVKEGDVVTRGQLLLSFERETLLAEGYELATPVVIGNCDEFVLTKTAVGQVRPGDMLFTLTRTI